MTAVPNVTPVFIIDPHAPPGNVIPALARLLIDVARRNLTNAEQPIMLKECAPLTFSPLAEGLQHGQ